MAENVEAPVILESQTGNRKPGVFVWVRYNNNERLRRAVKGGLIGFAAAMGLYLIPFVHLPMFAMPALFISLYALFGVIVGFIRFRRRQSAQAVKGDCPDCKTAIKLPLEADDKVPIRTYCPNCNKPLHIMSSSG